MRLGSIYSVSRLGSSCLPHALRMPFHCQAKHDITKDLNISLNYRKSCSLLQLSMTPPTLKYSLMRFYQLNTFCYLSIPVAFPIHPFILENSTCGVLSVNKCKKGGYNEFYDTNHLCSIFLCDLS